MGPKRYCDEKRRLRLREPGIDSLFDITPQIEDGRDPARSGPSTRQYPRKIETRTDAETLQVAAIPAGSREAFQAAAQRHLPPVFESLTGRRVQHEQASDRMAPAVDKNAIHRHN